MTKHVLEADSSEFLSGRGMTSNPNLSGRLARRRRENFAIVSGVKTGFPLQKCVFLKEISLSAA